MRKWIEKRYDLQPGVDQVIGASETNEPISKDFYLVDPTRLRVYLKADSVTAGSGITLKIQSRFSDGPWVDGKTASVTDENTEISLNPEVSGDQTHVPLRPIVRIVLTTTTGSAITVKGVYVSNFW